MNKEFVPYELAVKLKELGFDGTCFGWYENNELVTLLDCVYPEERLEFIKVGEISKRILTPTFSQCFKWFREKYQIFPEVLTDCTTEPKFVYTYNTFYGNPKDLTEQEWGWENNIGQYSDIYRTYEEAELECLKKLIEIVESKSE